MHLSSPGVWTHVFLLCKKSQYIYRRWLLFILVENYFTNTSVVSSTDWAGLILKIASFACVLLRSGGFRTRSEETRQVLHHWQYCAVLGDWRSVLNANKERSKNKNMSKNTSRIIFPWFGIRPIFFGRAINQAKTLSGPRHDDQKYISR